MSLASPPSSSSPPSPSLRVFDRQSWINSASRRQMVCMAGAVGAIVFLATALVQLLFYEEGRPSAVMLLSSDALAGIFAGLLSLRLMHSAWERHQAMKQRLHMIAELNHEVRNALDLIQLSAHMTHDAETIQRIGSAIERIERTLREVQENWPPAESTGENQQ